MPFIRPITIRLACEYVTKVHRHHRPPQGALFAVSLVDDEGQVAGVAIVGRPVARMLQDGLTAEVTRLAVKEGVRNGCSMLYGAAKRICQAMGYSRLYTYTLASEPGTSLRASGFECEGEAGGGSWSVPSRPRQDKHPLEKKTRWMARLAVQHKNQQAC